MSVERMGEVLARPMTRRRVLSTSAATAFATVAAWTVGATKASANTCQATESVCGCDPPNATYCTHYSSSYCSGAACAGGCTYYYGFYSQTACWCTKKCCYKCGTIYSYCGYYKCCDCKCNGTLCGCRHFVYTCSTAAPASAGQAHDPERARPARRPDPAPCC